MTNINSMDLKTYHHVVGSSANEFQATGLSFGQYFPWCIVRMNTMYTLPINESPTIKDEYLNEPPEARLQKFLGVLSDEISEGHEILALMQARRASHENVDITEQDVTNLATSNGVSAKRAKATAETFMKAYLHDKSTGFQFNDDGTTEVERQILVALGDWLGDMVVYIRSESLKYGIPLESMLACIMGSNFTKLDENGLPIKNEATGKVEKGPNFMPPEQHIYATLFGTQELITEYEGVSQLVNDFSVIGEELLCNPMTDILHAEGLDTDEDEDDEAADEDYDEEEELKVWSKTLINE